MICFKPQEYRSKNKSAWAILYWIRLRGFFIQDKYYFGYYGSVSIIDEKDGKQISTFSLRNTLFELDNEIFLFKSENKI
jgi:hypothetical protein